MQLESIVEARVVHAALLHCVEDKGCWTCPIKDTCSGDVSNLIALAIDVVEELLDKRLIERYTDRQTRGLKVKCHLDADGCEDLKDGAWCSRFGCHCADVHIDEEKEDE